MSIPQPAASGVPDFDSLSFEDAIRLFKQWGFQVEPGPRPEEVTLILEGPGYRTHSVHDAHILPKMAAVALHAHWQNGMLTHQREQQGKSQRIASCKFVESVF
jgi:hypothetical protein